MPIACACRPEYPFPLHGYNNNLQFFRKIANIMVLCTKREFHAECVIRYPHHSRRARKIMKNNDVLRRAGAFGCRPKHFAQSMLGNVFILLTRMFHMLIISTAPAIEAGRAENFFGYCA